MADEQFAWVDEGNQRNQRNRLTDDCGDELSPFEIAAMRNRRGVKADPRSIPLATGLGNAVRVGNKLMTDPAVGKSLINRLTGEVGGEERMTTWPERMARGAHGILMDAATGELGTVRPDASGMVSDEAIGKRQQRDFQGVQDLSNAVIGGSLPMAAARGLAKDTLGVVPIAAAKKTNVPVKTTHPPEFIEAVKNTKGAELTPDGLVLNLARAQAEEQAGKPSVRGGVFYFPSGSRRAMNNYHEPTRAKKMNDDPIIKKPGDDFFDLGGDQYVEGGTLVKNPLVVKGDTIRGSLATNAVKELGIDKNLKYWANNIDGYYGGTKQEHAERVIKSTEKIFENYKLGPMPPELVDFIKRSSWSSDFGGGASFVGNAVRELIVAKKAREMGYDSIIGLNKGKIDEVFDVRESHYPTPEGGYQVHPQFRSGLDGDEPGLPATVPTSQMSKPAPVFYSGVENALEHSTTALATPDQWLGTLRNARGVKPEELQWLGVEDFLAEKKAAGEKVSRAELQEFIKNNKIDVKEVQKGQGIERFKTAEEAKKELKEQALDDDYAAEVLARNDPAEMVRVANEYASDLDAMTGGTKYEDYQLPGGRDYGELLLTLPERTEGKEVGPKGWAETGNSRSQSGSSNYASSHWDEPNVLAHVRYNTRDVDGKKTLHLEEIQSDWHQAGKKQGYKQQIPEAERPAAIEKLHDLEAQLDQLYSKRDTTGYAALKVETDILRQKITGDAGVPDAPFKKSWPELAFKRMLRHAAENGYDAISWTPGEAQAARYDLSKVYKVINAVKREDGTYMVQGQPAGYEASPMAKIADRVAEDKLPDYVGKDLAEKIKEQGGGKFEGVDLKVGGEGMKRFYDDQLVAIANKYAKAHGGKVEQKPLGNELSIQEVPANDPKQPPYYYVDDPANPDFKDKMFDTRKEAEDFVKQHSPAVHYMELPKTLRDTALQKGFPLFSHGVMLTPVEGNPFEDNKGHRP